MSVTWAKNHLGMTLTEEEMKDIPNPNLELGVHVTLKFVQGFTLLGTCLVGPLAAVARRHTRNLAGIRATAFRFGTRGAILGVPVGILATYGKLRTIEGVEPVWDRCYRLRHNEGQVRVDQWSVVDTALGSGVSAALGAGVAPGFCLGMTCAILGSCWYTNAGPGKKNK